MEEVALDSWDAFQAHVEGLEEEQVLKRPASESYISDLLYRGQDNATYPLSTTLERKGGVLVSVAVYMAVIRSLKPEISTWTNRVWDLPENVEIKVEQGLDTVNPTAAYEYMAFLRHYGFPSPLLDWTRSPFVAAYFAFANPPRDAERIAVYAFTEYAGKGKRWSSPEATIQTLGPTILVDERHFLQQSQYSYCYRDVEGQPRYCPHEEAFGRNDPDQDRLWKFTLPTAERRKALIYLERHNISGFSLFRSVDRLMESLFHRVEMSGWLNPSLP